MKDIKSDFILKTIFKHLSHKLILRIIKYNKNLLHQLNIAFEDYKIYGKIKNLMIYLN